MATKKQELERKKRWRDKNKDKISEYNRNYRLRLKKKGIKRKDYYTKEERAFYNKLNYNKRKKV